MTRDPLGDPVQTVGAMLAGSDGKVLLGLRAKSKKAYPEHWDVVGGHVEAGETLDEALIREVSEEIGVTPTSFWLLAAIPEKNPERHGDAVHHIFAVTDWTGSPVNKSDEHAEIRWFGPDELSTLTNLADADYARLARQAIILSKPE